MTCPLVTGADETGFDKENKRADPPYFISQLRGVIQAGQNAEASKPRLPHLEMHICVSGIGYVDPAT